MAVMIGNKRFVSLKLKMGIVATGLMLAVSLTYTVITLVNMARQQKNSVDSQQHLMLQGYDEKIKWQVDNVCSLLKTYDELYKAQGFSLEERKDAVKEIVRGLRYGTEGYFWIDTFDGVNILLPPKPAVEGTNRLDWTDEDGKHMVRDFIEIGKTDNGGYVDFKYPKFGSDKPQPKRSYTAPYKPFQWVVGTGNYIDEIDAAREVLQKELTKDFKTVVISQIVLSICIVVGASILFIIFTIRFFVHPLSGITDNLKNISEGEGDLTVSLRAKGNDEIALLSLYFNKTIEKIRGVIASVKSTSDAMPRIGAQLADSTDNVSESINQIIANINGIGSQIQEQNASVHQTADAVDTIAESITQLDDMIESQSAGVTQASAAVEEMIGNIFSVTSSVDKMAVSFEELSSNAHTGVNKQNDVNERIKQIGEQSEMLQEANTAISSIAEQTNLLAMNAAIEAAHAGEAGKGFSVVADEIRKLSETSSAQSKTIGEQLNKIKDSIIEVVSASMESSEAFAAVSSRLKETDQLVVQIKGAMEEQNAGSRQISDALKDMNDSTVEVRRASKDMANKNTLILKEIDTLRNSTAVIKSSMEEMSSEAGKVGENGSTLTSITDDVQDAIHKISTQIDLFKV